MIAGMSSFSDRPARAKRVSVDAPPSFRATNWANMFSSMTIESSMIRPTAAAIPPSVMMLIVFPTTSRQTIVEAIVTGTTSAITIATRQLRRNTRRTTIASAMPITMLSRVLCIELSINPLWSYQFSKRTPEGSFSARRAPITSFPIWTVLPVGCFMMLTRTASRPRAVVRMNLSATDGSTSATSLT